MKLKFGNLTRAEMRDLRDLSVEMRDLNIGDLCLDFNGDVCQCLGPDKMVCFAESDEYKPRIVYFLLEQRFRRISMAEVEILE